MVYMMLYINNVHIIMFLMFSIVNFKKILGNSEHGCVKYEFSTELQQWYR